MGLKSVLDRFKRNKIISKYKNDPWYQLLREVQEEVVLLNCHPLYKERYRSEELFYWLHIPRWLAQSPMRVENLLDIGCCHATLALYAKKSLAANVYAIDFIKYISDELIEKYDITYKTCNIETEEFPWDVKYDVILFTEVIEHLNFDPVPTLKKIKNLLSDNGRLYITTPDAREWGKTRYYNSYKQMPAVNPDTPIRDDHIYQFNEEELFELFDAVGLRVKELDYAPGIRNRHINMELVKDTPAGGLDSQSKSKGIRR